jgi:ABC-type uncharacterized transport system permease subunit
MLMTFSFTAAALYVLAAFLPQSRRQLVSLLTALALLAHAASLVLAAFTPDQTGMRAGFAVMLSVALWVSALVYWIENWRLPLDGLKVLLLPYAAAMAVLPVFFSGALIALAGKPAMYPWHIVVALSAYSTLTVAAFHALVMTLQNAHLHNLGGKPAPSWLSVTIDRLPAILAMERILFRLIWIGFVLLSLTVLSGVIFSEEILGVALQWNHKSILSLLSWLLFGILLAGRQWRGWRGKTVLKFTLGGFVTLLLAYVGTRFVLEVLLHRSWT